MRGGKVAFVERDEAERLDRDHGERGRGARRRAGPPMPRITIVNSNTVGAPIERRGLSSNNRAMRGASGSSSSTATIAELSTAITPARRARYNR